MSKAGDSIQPTQSFSVDIPPPFMAALCNSYTMAARDFADIYTQSARAAGPRAAGVYVSKIPSSHGTSDIYHLGRTHLIGERTNENSSHLFYTVASEDRLWF